MIMQLVSLEKVACNHYGKCIPVPFEAGEISDELFKDMKLLHTSHMCCFSSCQHFNVKDCVCVRQLSLAVCGLG